MRFVSALSRAVPGALALSPLAVPVGGCALHRPVDVEVVGVELAAARADGTPWDGPAGDARTGLRALAGELAGSEPLVAALVSGAGAAAERLAAPDTFGVATLIPVEGEARTVAIPVVPDTATPAWCGSGAACPRIEGVTLGRVRALELRLQDDDLDEDDALAPVVVDRRALRRALRGGDAEAVDVAAQGDGEVVRVRVRVTRAEP